MEWNPFFRFFRVKGLSQQESTRLIWTGSKKQEHRSAAIRLDWWTHLKTAEFGLSFQCCCTENDKGSCNIAGALCKATAMFTALQLITLGIKDFVLFAQWRIAHSYPFLCWFTLRKLRFSSNCRVSKKSGFVLKPDQWDRLIATPLVPCCIGDYEARGLDAAGLEEW